MEFIEKIHPVFRWLLFIPAGMVAFIIFTFANLVSLNYFFGYNMSETIIGSVIRNFMGVYVGVGVTVLFAPKGRIIIASIITGFFVMVLGGVIFINIIRWGSFGTVAVVEVVLNVAACITLLVSYVKYS